MSDLSEEDESELDSDLMKTDSDEDEDDSSEEDEDDDDDDGSNNRRVQVENCKYSCIITSTFFRFSQLNQTSAEIRFSDGFCANFSITQIRNELLFPSLLSRIICCVNNECFTIPEAVNLFWSQNWTQHSLDQVQQEARCQIAL